MDPVKVMIVDDHVVVREGLKQLLEVNEDVQVIAEAKGGLECLNLLESVQPDLIFMDIKMPGINGIETTRLVTERFPECRIILLTIYEDDDHVTEGIRAGAKGYMLKNAGRDELLMAVRHVMNDEAYLDPTITSAVIKAVKEAPGEAEKEEKSGLTQRELEILVGLAAGQSDLAIAEDLAISKHTVRSHIKSLFRKLGVQSRSQAIVKAMQQGIIDQSG
jgi:DNA-binding NarL/FixJ family response regulator